MPLSLPSAVSGGADGKVIYGTGAPAAGTGVDGDSYVDQTNHRLYGPKAAGAWPGTYQDLGTTPDGKTLYGAGAPTGSDGANGDSWVDTTNSRLYGPKAAGAWPGTYISLGGALPVGGPGQLGRTTANGTAIWLPDAVQGRSPDDSMLPGRVWQTSFVTAEEDNAQFTIGPYWQRAVDANGYTVLRMQNSTLTGDTTSGSNQVTNLTAPVDNIAIAGAEVLSGSGIPGNTAISAVNVQPAAGTATTTSGNTQLTAVAVTAGTFSVGQPFVGTGIPAATTITAVTATTITMSAAATASAAGVAISGRGTVTIAANATATASAVALTLNREAAEATLFTKAQDVRDVEILLKYLPKSTTSASSAYARGYGRYTGPNNYWRGRKRYHTVGGSMVEDVEINGNTSATILTYITNADNTQGVPRHMRVRVQGDAIYWKHWFAWTNWRGGWSAAATYAAGDGVSWSDGGVGPNHVHAYVAIGAIAPTATNPSVDTTNWRPVNEPTGWQYIRRVRGADGASSQSPTVDNPEIGAAGFGFQRLTADVYEFTAIELAKRPTNALWNAQLRNIESVDLVPVGWYRQAAASGGNTLDIADVTLPQDAGNPLAPTRKALHFLHTVGQGNFWCQSIYNARQMGAMASAPKRMRKHPQGVLAQRYRITGWSKGTNIVNTAPSTNAVSASCDVYYYSRHGISVSSTDAGVNSLMAYFWALGPDGPAGHGAGTWDWYFFDLWLVLQVPDEVAYINPQFGIHDASTGELWVCDPKIEPVG